jgi:hypothetical protein
MLRSASSAPVCPRSKNQAKSGRNWVTRKVGTTWLALAAVTAVVSLGGRSGTWLEKGVYPRDSDRPIALQPIGTDLNPAEHIARGGRRKTIQSGCSAAASRPLQGDYMKSVPWDQRIASVFVFIFMAVCIPAAQAAISAGERTVLLNLYTSTNGASWTTSTHWNGAAGTECTWFGITCDGALTTVTEIVLPTNNLTGSLPSDLNNLTNLTNFSVAGNQLSGAIPALSGLTALQYFLVQHNQFTGSIPELTGLTSLVAFDVGSNRLTGSIPALTGLTSLSVMGVDENHLTGSIPELSGLTNLQLFAVARNHLTGPIPSLAGLTNLIDFTAWSNQLTGSIPALTGLTKLGAFAVEENQLTGSIPALTGLTNLDTFYVHDNKLTGSIPDLSGAPNLLQFDVSENQLTGSIPSLDGLTKLNVFHVENNQIIGDVPPVPSPNSLLAGVSGLCPNYLNHTPEPAWDAATGTTPWYADCTAPPCSTIDIDGNGKAEALTDGLLMIRYLFGLRGTALIQGAVAPGAPRTSAAAIESCIKSLLP